MLIERRVLVTGLSFSERPYDILSCHDYRSRIVALGNPRGRPDAKLWGPLGHSQLGRGVVPSGRQRP